MGQLEIDDELTDAVRLALVPGVGPRHWATLVERFGSPRGVLDAAPSLLRAVPGVGPKLSGGIAAARESGDAPAQIALCRERGVQIVARGSPDYPRPLDEIPDPPPLLFVHGDLQPSDALAVAIVGSRHATHYGLTQAERLAAGLRARASPSRAGWPGVSMPRPIAARFPPAAGPWLFLAAACSISIRPNIKSSPFRSEGEERSSAKRRPTPTL